MLVHDYSGPVLVVGDKVQALIKGIISDDDTIEQLITLYVVRVEGDRVGLSFRAETDQA